MRKLEYINGQGVGVELYKAPYLIERLEGISSPDLDVQTQKAPYQDGETYISNQYGPRTITVTCAMSIDPQDFASINAARNDLYRIFNPKAGPGRLIYTADGVAPKFVDCIPSGSPVFVDKPWQDPFQRFQVSMFCADPFFKDMDEKEQSVQTLSGGLTFPMTFPFTLGTFLVGQSVEMVNNGHVKSPVRITFSGAATNPKILNETTGEYIKILKTLISTDVITVDTAFDQRTVKLNGVNAMQYLDLASTFWGLEPGVNDVSFTDDVASTSAQCLVEWNDQYIGV